MAERYIVRKLGRGSWVVIDTTTSEVKKDFGMHGENAAYETANELNKKDEEQSA